MLQHITTKQIQKLNAAETAILNGWLKDKNYEPTLLIGQMFEFIQDMRPKLKGVAHDRFGKWFVTIDAEQFGHNDQLADALWETITRILKTEAERK